MKIINEGVRFGEKEINNILSRSGDFNIGVEYEIRPTDDQQAAMMVNDFDKWGLSDKIDKIIPEHDSMTEVITYRMSLKDGLEHIRGMFEYLTEKNIEVPEMAGMHISISTNKYILGEFNPIKFYLLMNTDYIHSIFPERRHVNNSYANLKDSLHMIISNEEESGLGLEGKLNNLTSKDIKYLEDILIGKLYQKYQTINIGDYSISDGRIELRFFGGENYHKLYGDIKQQLLRSLFLLELAYTDLFQKEYLTELSKVLTDIRTEIKRHIPTEEIRKNQQTLMDAIKEENAKRIISILKYNTIGVKPEKLPPKLEEKIKSIVKNDPNDAVMYASVTNKPFKEGEDVIATDAEASYHYAKNTLEGRFEKGEDAILEHGSLTNRYLTVAFGDDRIPKELENKIAESSPVYVWLLYLKKMKDNELITDQELEDMPTIDVDRVVSHIYGFNVDDIKDMVKLKIINEDNIEDVLTTLANNPSEDNGYKLPVLVMQYTRHNNIKQLDVPEDVRIKMILKEYDIAKYLGELTVDEKIALMKSLRAFLVKVSGKDEEEMNKNLTKGVIDRESEIFKPLYPFGDEFIQKYKELTGHDLPKEAGKPL